MKTYEDEEFERIEKMQTQKYEKEKMYIVGGWYLPEELKKKIQEFEEKKMTKDEIEEIAELSGLYLYKTNEELFYCLTYFAKLVAEKELEWCASFIEELDERGFKELAGLIRARGQE